MLYLQRFLENKVKIRQLLDKNGIAKNGMIGTKRNILESRVIVIKHRIIFRQRCHCWQKRVIVGITVLVYRPLCLLKNVLVERKWSPCYEMG